MKHILALRSSSRVALAVAALAAFLFLVGVRVNVSPSVPRGLYLKRRLLEDSCLKQGQYVLLRVDAPAAPRVLEAGVIHVAYRTLLKRIEGLPGDVITSAELVAVNGRQLEKSAWRSHDAEGRPMPRPSLPLRLGPQQLWLGSSHELGIDSRYFGPVDARALEGVAEPLWTF